MAMNSSSQRIKVLLLGSSLLTLLLLLYAALTENFSGDWRTHQKAYRKAIIERAKTEKAREAAERFEVRLRQIVMPDLGRMDRCVTCHTGIDNQLMTDAALPIRKHSGSFLEDHLVDKFGCTVCHDGQGRAVDMKGAHGDVKHWLARRLAGKTVYTTCGRCHYENDLYGAERDLYYAKEVTFQPIDQAELEWAVAGSGSIAKGKKLALDLGCLGCHKYHGRGGVLGPEITHVGDKTVHDFDFTHLHGEHTVSRWLFEHFKNPQAVSPGTLMPDLGLTDEQAHALKDYMLSLHRKTMPTLYTPIPPKRSGNTASGKQLYSMFCSACHGRNGQGSTVRDSLEDRAVDSPQELMVPSLNHPDTLSVASNEYLGYIIRNGRPNTTMIPWQRAQPGGGFGGGSAEGGGGLWHEEIERIVQAVRSWQPPHPDLSAVAASRGDARMGQSLYRSNCAACHGFSGQGDIGPSLRTPGFLGVASDEFLAHSIIDGRPNTAMPSWRELDSLQISDLIALFRSWYPSQSERGETLKLLKVRRNNANVSARIGRILYQANCTMCHGGEGEGDLGPSLSTQEFLTLAGNDYLFETISSGRPGTGMPAWSHLSNMDVASLIRFVRTWQTASSRRLPEERAQGDWDTGRRLFEGLCVSCHGNHAEGGVGPQLNNPVFLRIASNAMLREWIAYGKSGTPMRAFVKGGQGTAELSSRQIDDLVSYLRSLEWRERVASMKSPSGRPELGRLWFATVCASCHGAKGEGASGPSLANRQFLNAASDGFLMATMARGRDGTEMRPLKKSAQSIVSLSSDQINDVVATLRLWEMASPDSGIPHNFVIPWDLGYGRETYVANCSGCHGVHGKAEKEEARLSAWAPELNNEGFLSGATDGFLQATIVKGRMGTAMRPFGTGLQGLADLSSKDIDDVVAYIRQWSTRTGSPMTLPAQESLVAARPANPEKAATAR